MSEAYKQAGVDTKKTDAFVKDLKEMTASVQDDTVLSDYKGFAAQTILWDALEEDAFPVLVTATDGVGTKLLLAQELGVHDTVGIDLVAMCVNDIVTCGAKPLVFLDYISSEKFEDEKMRLIMSGIVEGCKRAGVNLVGGETAEMPSMFGGKLHQPSDRYELVGFSAGLVHRNFRILGDYIQDGHVVYGLPSSGFHSNGYSLIRQRFEGKYHQTFSGKSWGDIFLEPTRIYTKEIVSLLHAKPFNYFNTIRGIAHITGGGIRDNVARLLPEDLGVELEKWDRDPMWDRFLELAEIDEAEAHTVFNMGIGMVLIACDDKDFEVDEMFPQRLEEACPELIRIGKVKAGVDGVIFK